MTSLGEKPAKTPGSRVVALLTWAARLGAVLALLLVFVALSQRLHDSDKPFFQVVVFVLVITGPQFLVDWIAAAAERVAHDALEKREIQRGFWNLGAWVGAVERPLMLGALIGGFAEFIAGWYVLKGIAGYQLELSKEAIAARRAFQLFLLNNAVSFAGVAVCLWIWHVLGL